jgi:hypothetical protein
MNQHMHTVPDGYHYMPTQPEHRRVAFTYEYNGIFELAISRDTSRSINGRSYEKATSFYYTDKEEMLKAKRLWIEHGKRPPLDSNGVRI